MAIKKKGEEKNIPAKLQSILTAAFSFQAVKSAYEAAYKTKTDEVKSYFESNDDGFDVSTGKGAGFACDEGTVQIKQLRDFETDTDKIIELVESGKITLTSLLGAVTFRQTDLETVLGSNYSDCVKVADKAGISVTLIGSAEFKTQTKEKIGDLTASAPDESKPALKKIDTAKVKEVVAKVKDNLTKVEALATKIDESVNTSKIKAARAKIAKLKAKASPDEDLESILGEK